MGIQDRDYYWEDRKRRENKYKKDGTYCSPNEPKKNNGTLLGKSSSAWQGLGGVARNKWMLIFTSLASSFVTFWVVMAILNLNADLLYIPFDITKKALSAVGAL